MMHVTQDIRSVFKHIACETIIYLPPAGQQLYLPLTEGGSKQLTIPSQSSSFKGILNR